MKVRILSGNAAGGVQEVEDVVGQSLIDTGYAERVLETEPAAPEPVVEAPSAPADLEADARAADDAGDQGPADGAL